jgi:5-methylcytosine-specific restriction endonuclease McrA
MRGLLAPLFELKDSQRTFSSEQRRILWNRDERPACRICRKPLTWNDITIDHVKAWSKGGPTNLTNAQLAHRACNSRKGAR